MSEQGPWLGAEEEEQTMPVGGSEQGCLAWSYTETCCFILVACLVSIYWARPWPLQSFLSFPLCAPIKWRSWQPNGALGGTKLWQSDCLSRYFSIQHCSKLRGGKWQILGCSWAAGVNQPCRVNNNSRTGDGARAALFVLSHRLTQAACQ